LFDRLHQQLTHAGKFEGLRGSERGDFPEVSAGREELLVAGDDERARVLCEFPDDGREGLNAGTG